VPHVTNKIQQRLREVGEGHDFLIAEIGGTVGDFESGCFYEAISQFKHKSPNDVMVVMVAPVIWNATVKEFKTKPLQNAVRSLRHDGLSPDMLLCRCDRTVPQTILNKVAMLTGVPQEAVFEAPDVQTIYEVPIAFYDRHIDDLIADRFHLPRRGVRIHKYRELVEKYTNGHDLPRITIGIVGKYDNCDEAYVSLKEALTHAAVDNNVKHDIRWIDAKHLETEKDAATQLAGLHGVIVPGGFDVKGVEGKIKAIKYCRENKIPFLGICLGLQCAVIEFARNVMKYDGATSQEFDGQCKIPVIHFVDGQSVSIKKSATMRLGSFECELDKDTLAKELYKKRVVSERHRHRYEVNDKFVQAYADKGFIVSGRNPGTGLIEIMELKRDLHPFFIGTQAHPEFKSKLDSPAPLFAGLIKAAIETT
jgi:CTP synthase